MAARLKEIGHPIAQSSISKIENNKRTVDVDDLMALAVALGVTPNRLLLGDRVEGERFELTPAVSANGRDAWAWANGERALTEGYPRESLSDAERCDDFRRNSWPVGLRPRVARLP